MKKWYLTLVAAVFAVGIGTAVPVYAQEAQVEEQVEQEAQVEEQIAEEVQRPQPQQIRFDRAMQMALANSSALVDLEDRLENLTEQRDALRNLLELRRFAGTITPPEEAALLRQIADLNAVIHTMQYGRTMTRVGVEMQLLAILVTIRNLELDIYLAEANIIQYENNVNIAQLRLNSGLGSESDLRTAEMNLQQREAGLSTQRVSLETEWNSLRRLLQLSMDHYFYIDYEMIINPLPTDLNQHIRDITTRQRQMPPNLRQREVTLNRARAVLNDTVNQDTPARTQAQRAHDQAVRERDELIRTLETGIRNQYNTIRMLQQTYESLQIGLAQAVERRDVAQLNYQAGLVTPFVIESAELGILAAEIAIQKNLHTQWLSQFRFDNPFLLAS